jgi:hypothetical protein
MDFLKKKMKILHTETASPFSNSIKSERAESAAVAAFVLPERHFSASVEQHAVTSSAVRYSPKFAAEKKEDQNELFTKVVFHNKETFKNERR